MKNLFIAFCIAIAAYLIKDTYWDSVLNAGVIWILCFVSLACIYEEYEERTPYDIERRDVLPQLQPKNQHSEGSPGTVT